jgi:rod shape-determining protein MreC
MRNLWIFISKYNAFFLFIIFFVFSLIIISGNNSYQRSVVLNTSNELVGQANEQSDYFKSYLKLNKVNDSLALENARLRNALQKALPPDTVRRKTVMDTISHQQYMLTEARVINNSTHQKNNYLTINRGSAQGIKDGMGVISSNGIVGIVRGVSANYARIQSLLHSATKISAGISGTNAIGSLMWGEGNYNPQTAVLEDIPNHIVVKPGQKIVTSNYSVLFPAGIPIGRILHTGIKGGNNFLDIEVLLSTDFRSLQYVYVVNNLRASEQLKLEQTIKDNE